MRKAPFLAVLVLLLGGCTAGGEKADDRGDNSSETAEEQMGNLENDRLYVREEGGGDLICAARDTGLKNGSSDGDRVLFFGFGG